MALPTLPKFEIPLQTQGVTTKNWYFFFQSIVNFFKSIALTVTDGTHSVDNVNQLKFIGGTVSGTSPDATVSITGISPIANNEVLGNISGGTANPIGLTQAQFTAIINQFTSSLAGDVPASGGGTANFLRADGTWAPAGGANVTPDTHPSSPTNWDDEFEFGSSIDTSGSRFSGANAWSWTNQGTATTSVSEGSLVFFSKTSSSGRDTSMVLQSLSGAGSTWTFTCKCQLDNVGVGPIAGMIVQGSGGYAFIGLISNGTGTISWRGQTLTNPTTLSATLFSTPNAAPWPSPGGTSSFSVYMQIQLTAASGGTLNFLYSVTGVPGSFLSLGSTPLSTLLTNVTNIGLFVDPEANGAFHAVYDWFRKTA